MAEALRGDLSLLAENLPLLLERREEIFDEPEFFFSEPSFARVSVLYLHQGPVPLGVLLKLWSAGGLSVPCPGCPGRVCVYRLGGSPLSGTHFWAGICSACRGTISERGGPDVRGEPFAKFAMPLIDAMAENRNEAVIERGERPRFSWGRGLAGRRTPDRVLVPAASGVPFRRLIGLLKGEPSITEVRRLEGTVACRFDWADRTLRSPGGKVLFQVQGRWIRDPSRSAVHEWDGLYLRTADDGALYEVCEETARGPAREGGRIVIRTVAPLRFGQPDGLTTVIRRFEGPPLYEWDPPHLLRHQGEALYEFDDPIPLGLAILIAEGGA